MSKFFDCLRLDFDTYDGLWAALDSVVVANGTHLPEKSHLTAWNRAGTDFEGVSMSGELKFFDQPSGPLFKLRLSPLKMEPTYRLARKFGGDRFLVLAMPGIGPENLPANLKDHHAVVREAIVRWLVDVEHSILGRKWRAFYVKAQTSKKAAKAGRSVTKDSRFRVFLFAEDGPGFGQATRKDESDRWRISHPRMAVRELIEWFMSLKVNKTEPCLKLFARLALGSFADLRCYCSN